MVNPFAKDPEPTTSLGAERARADLDERFQHLRQDADAMSDSAGDAATHRARQAAEALADAVPGGRTSSAGASSANFRAQASQAANEAKGAAASIAEQARSRLTEMVDQQKAAGAARIAGVAQAAQSAAKDLDTTNPELARLVRAAADGVDRIASDVRGRDIGDVIDTLASFGRRQPVAFFGGAVLTGFLLARFFKSDAPLMADDPTSPV